MGKAEEWLGSFLHQECERLSTASLLPWGARSDPPGLKPVLLNTAHVHPGSQFTISHSEFPSVQEPGFL